MGFAVFARAARDAGCLDVKRGTRHKDDVVVAIVRDGERWLLEEEADDEWKGVRVEDALRLAGLQMVWARRLVELARKERRARLPVDLRGRKRV